MKYKYFIFILIFINIFSIKAYATSKGNEDIVKIGVYEYEPYIMVDSNGNISRYYDDFFKLISEKYDFQYEYVLSSLSKGLEKLENNNIDIMAGVPIIKIEKV